MTSFRSPSAIAERVQRRRNRILWLFALLFFVWQGAYLNSRGLPVGPLRAVDLVRDFGHVLLAVVLLALMATGGGWRHGPAVRALLNDESTRAHRALALTSGFWALTIAVLALYAAAPFVRIEAGEAAHVLLSIAVAVPALRFAMLERRADRG